MAREPFNRTWAENPVQFEEPTETTWTLGWEGGADKNPPSAAQENWWHNRADVALRAIERLGAMVWHIGAEYQQGAICVASDSEKYISVLSGVNIGNDPVSDSGDNWVRYYDGAPPGQVSAFAMMLPPGGWLIADGRNLSRSQYARLFNAIGTIFGEGDGSTTFSIPDLRGEFLRGWDDDRGVDLGRSFGSTQQDAIQNIEGSVSGAESASSTAAFFGGDTSGAFATSATRGDPVINSVGTGVRYSKLTFNAARTVRTDDETRPRNVALLYCIKF